MQRCYRDKFDIIESILNITNGNGVPQVEILNKANIPFRLFKEYLFLLHECGLIQIKHERLRRTYKTTKKGTYFLTICTNMNTVV
jgi:predicted transcriptional regulator